MSLTQHQVMTMLELQGQMNTRVNPEWLRAGYPYLRAVVVEGAEAMEHHGWKWWKAQSLDLDQLRMELVDIWHFMLSESLILARGDLTAAASAVMSKTGSDVGVIVFDEKRYLLKEMNHLAKLELMIGLAVARRMSVELFECLLDDCGMTWSDLFQQYVAKNVLNMFRQDFGYKDGSYQKEWAGREDNAHLVEIMGMVAASDIEYKDVLYDGLRVRYTSLVLQPQAS